MEKEKNIKTEKTQGENAVTDNAPKANEPREKVRDLDQSYWGIVKRQFRKNKLAVWSFRIIIVLAIIGLSADFLANNKPLVAKIDGKVYFPILKQYTVDWGLSSWPKELSLVRWKSISYDFVIWPPIPYAQDEYDIANGQFKGPFEEQRIESFRWRHWFGTDEIGRDVLSGMIHGTRIAMLVGLVSMSIATCIGIILGALAGYYGDDRLKLSRIRIILNFLFVVFAGFYAFMTRSSVLSNALSVGLGLFIGQLILSIFIFIGIMIVPNVLATFLEKIAFLGHKVRIPVDILISRAIEVLLSIPRLLLILSIVAIAKPSIMLVMVIIGATSWTGIARFTRGELLRVRNLEYIEAAQSLGFKELRIIFRHALPNSLTPVLIAVAFGVAGAILTESFLSFLGIGVEAEVITWGKLLSIARTEHEAWWLAIAPGFAIFITVTIFNLLGEGLTDALDPRLKQ